VAAYLNCLLVADVALCVSRDNGNGNAKTCVRQMWSGSYCAPNSNKIWQQADCQEYMQRCCIG